MWWYHHTRTVCIHHTSVPGRWIIHRYILSHWYFAIFFFVCYGRQLRQLTNVQNYGLLDPTPRHGKLNVLVDLHPLAQIIATSSEPYVALSTVTCLFEYQSIGVVLMKCNTAVTDFAVTTSWSKLASRNVVVVTLFPSGLGMSFRISSLMFP